MKFDTSMQQGGESAVEGTTYAVRSVKTAGVDLKRLPSFPSKSIWNVFFRDDDYSADIVVGGAHLSGTQPHGGNHPTLTGS